MTLVNQTNIKPGYITDHSIVELESVFQTLEKNNAFYKKLYLNNDNNLHDVNLNIIVNYKEITKFNQKQRMQLEGKINIKKH